MALRSAPIALFALLAVACGGGNAASDDADLASGPTAGHPGGGSGESGSGGSVGGAGTSTHGASGSSGAKASSGGSAGDHGGAGGSSGGGGGSGHEGGATSVGAGGAPGGAAGTSGDPAGNAGTGGSPASGGAPASGGSPATIDDAEGEPTPAEVVKDPGATGDCLGPFDCILPNPAPGNRNRITNPLDGTDLFPLADGTQIVDGFGGPRGTVTSKKIQINFGQRKMLLGASHVYAFAVATTNGTESSWVLESAVQQSLAFVPTVLARDPGAGDYDQVFTVTGGDPSLYGDDKVIANFTMNNGAATDYVLRPGNVVNLLYGFIGGVSDDTFPASAGTPFKRSRGVASFYYNLYAPGSSTVIGTERFFYGHIGDRYGWIARDALDPPAAKPGPSMTFCCAKCASLTKYHQAPSGKECTAAATDYCAEKPTRGAFESMMIGDCIP